MDSKANGSVTELVDRYIAVWNETDEIISDRPISPENPDVIYRGNVL